MTQLIIDIETTITHQPWAAEYVTEGIGPPANYRSAEAIAKWRAEKGAQAHAEAVAKTALNGTLGEVTVICCQLRGDPTMHSFNAKAGESAMLGEFAGFLRDLYSDARRAGALTWTGYNIAGFDLRFLWQRLLVHNRRAAASVVPVQEKPWSSRICDLMQVWCGNDRQARVRKEIVARALGILVPPDAISGADAPVLWEAGEHDRVIRHCEQDVAMTMAIAERIT